ncbi:unnamed protein product [Protopolystoma xenopodis]|uniref:Uncharacterized protein n=1 Tax=Protopolystoma xenopodis TaxID=117903 RepID=A0A3S5ADR2_9PLAT|nr:unnamed protein product [Protopolystoma xenopodis]
MTGVVGGNKKRGGSNGVRDVGLNSLGSRRNQLGPSIQSTMGTSSATTLASGSHSSSSVRKQVGPTSMGSQQIQPPAGGGCANKSSSSSHPGPYLSSAVSNRGCSSASGQKTGSSGGRHACTEAGPNPGCVGGSDTSNKSAGSKNASTLTAAGGDHHASDAKQLGTGVNNREFRTSNSYNTVLADHSLGKDTHNS